MSATSSMISEEFTKASELISKATNILLIPHAKMDCDGMSAALSLYLVLRNLQKNPSAICTDPVPESFAFLPSTDVFSDDIPKILGNEKAFMISLNTDKKSFKDLKYEMKDGKVNILFFSDGAPFEEKDFSFIGTSFRPDLIITLDSGDTQQLGKIYSDNQELFEKTPIINIDHHISNTLFGDVNLVDYKACSTTEVIYSLLPLLDTEKNYIDENVATLLLAGMLTDTGSFQHANTTPRSLDIAADLIEKGARHQEIIKNLFKTKNLSTLRLWGRLLTKLQNDPIYRMIWSSVSKIDLEETQSKSEDADGLIDELLSTTPGTELVLLVKEREDGIISTSVRSSSPLVDSVSFAQLFGGGGHKQAAGFKIRDWGGKSFEEIVSDIVWEAKNFQATRLGIAPPVQNIKTFLATTNASEIPSEPAPQKNEELNMPPPPPVPPVEPIAHEEENKDEETLEAEHFYRPESEYHAPQTPQTEPEEELLDDFPLSEEESKLLGQENFGMPLPEKTIQKPNFEGFEKPKVQIDDFADFISQMQDNAKGEVFLPSTPSPGAQVAKALEEHHSEMHREEDTLASLRTSIPTPQGFSDAPTQSQPQHEDPFLASLK